MQRGFKVINIQVYGKFEPPQRELYKLKIGLTECSYDNHMEYIETINRKANKRSHVNLKTLTYTELPGPKIVELVHFDNLWINFFHH